MLHLIPGNQLELLVEPLNHLLAQPLASPLQPDIIMVQHQGMQHWLNMQLASHPQRQVSMNIEFPLPVRYMWTLIRNILGEDRVPQRSPYSREVLLWRIDAALMSDHVSHNPDFQLPTDYWRLQQPALQEVRRYQLAEQLADLYEQYQMFRPDWISAWDRGEVDHWQGQLWRVLSKAVPDHPVKLVKEAYRRLDKPEMALPERLFIFGINTMAPLWLDFLQAVAEQGETDIHVLYLNPCDEYWGEVISERQQARERARWVEQGDVTQLIADIGNPLIGSLGQQGQAFVKLLSEKAQVETPVFIEPAEGSMLHRLQRDLLKLQDGRATLASSDHSLTDDSILVTSAHSALREVQGLHDWLLHQFNADAALKPRDVLVMCPNVEEYAPFVEAVFGRAGEELNPAVPPLPCSIADRNLKNADITVATFLEMLSLPDARFQVNQVINWLRVPSIQQQFDILPEQIDQLAQWLKQAAVHWGIDQQHKAQWVNSEVTSQFTWQQGLDRLLLGFAWGDEITVVDEKLLLPQVEGADARLLGRMIQLLEDLHNLSITLSTRRTATDWQAFLSSKFKDALFAKESVFQAAHDEIQACIDNLADFCGQGDYSHKIDLPVVRQFITTQFVNPQRSGQQFLNGQITVCSMMPMRSIPFKILAVLGLNDGAFPRVRQPYGFDLMANDQPRLGDRSRRGDDRYLFLEALLSARDKLYLSYQGRQVKDNSEKQPSLVLTELMDYLHNAYGWCGAGIAENSPESYKVRQLPLQPFSKKNFTGQYSSFDGGWLQLSQPRKAPERTTAISAQENAATEIELQELIQFFDHPARYFARNRLGLFLQQQDVLQLEDSEPFTSNYLHRYQVQQDLVEAGLEYNLAATENIREISLLSGQMADNSIARQDLDDWENNANTFVDTLRASHADTITMKRVSCRLSGLIIHANLPVTADGSLLFWRLADQKGKDLVNRWLHHLVANIVLGSIATRGCYRQKPEQQGTIEIFTPVDQASELLKSWLEVWRNGMCQALPYNATIGKSMFEKATFGEADFLKLWRTNAFSTEAGLEDDPYMRWFWPEMPEWQVIYQDLKPLYQAIFRDSETQVKNLA